jgi:AraC family transcriptional activator of pobA
MLVADVLLSLIFNKPGWILISPNIEVSLYIIMEKIDTYSIAKLQKAFELTSAKSDYFYVDAGKDLMYTDEPFRTETYAILLLKEGCINLETDLNRHIVEAPAIITIGPTITRSFQRCLDKPNVEFLFFTESFLLETRSNIFYLAQYRFFEDNNLHVLKMEQNERSKVDSIFNLIEDTFNTGHSNEPLMMRSYTYLLIHEIDALHRTKNEIVTPGENNNSIFIKFKNLLSKEFWRHRSVGFYANNLNVNPKYLSEVVKRESGQTAGEWIDRAVVLEAKVLLQKKDISIAQVSDQLNFSDQSVFGKFFKNREGISPAEYRKKIK